MCNYDALLETCRYAYVYINIEKKTIFSQLMKIDSQNQTSAYFCNNNL